MERHLRWTMWLPEGDVVGVCRYRYLIFIRPPTGLVVAVMASPLIGLYMKSRRACWKYGAAGVSGFSLVYRCVGAGLLWAGTGTESIVHASSWIIGGRGIVGVGWNLDSTTPGRVRGRWAQGSDPEMRVS